MSRAILLISHGSHSKQARREIEALARRLKKSERLRVVECAFLEVEKPTIPEGIETCVRKGASEIVILLNFLNSGNHVLHDIPAILKTTQRRFPRVIFRMTPPIGAHPRIPALFAGLIRVGKKRRLT